MKICFIIAMDIEYQKMVQILGGDSFGVMGGNEIILCHSGIGKVNAALGAFDMMKQYQPDCIISTGLAGGIDDRLNVMDIVIAEQTCYHDVWCGEGNEKGQVQGMPARFDANPGLLDNAMRLKDGFGYENRLHKGLLCTGDQFITNRSEQQKIKNTFVDALAVDMESAAIAHACYRLGVPFLSIRIISDTPGNSDNHQQQWSEFISHLGNRSFRFIQLLLNNLPNSI